MRRGCVFLRGQIASGSGYLPKHYANRRALARIESLIKASGPGRASSEGVEGGGVTDSSRLPTARDAV